MDFTEHFFKGRKKKTKIWNGNAATWSEWLVTANSTSVGLTMQLVVELTGWVW